jgi:hypothetical protein
MPEMPCRAAGHFQKDSRFVDLAGKHIWDDLAVSRSVTRGRREFLVFQSLKGFSEISGRRRGSDRP